MKTKLFQALLGSIGKWLPVTHHPGGKIGRIFRLFCAKQISIQIDEDTVIDKGVMIHPGVILKNDVSIGVNCKLDSGTTIIGPTMIAPECLFFTSNHLYDKEKMMIVNGKTQMNPMGCGQFLGLKRAILNFFEN